MRMPKPRMTKMMSMPHPGNTPIVDHMQFTDARPTIAGPSTSFNPAQKAEVLPKGPPKYIQPGARRNVAQGETNRRFQYD